MAYSKNDLFSPSVGFLSSFDVNTRQAIAYVWPIADVINLLMPLLIYGMAYRTGFCQVSQVTKGYPWCLKVTFWQFIFLFCTCVFHLRIFVRLRGAALKRHPETLAQTNPRINW